MNTSKLLKVSKTKGRERRPTRELMGGQGQKKNLKPGKTKVERIVGAPLSPVVNYRR